MAGKGPDRHWKTTNYNMSCQIKRLEKEKTKLLKTFDRIFADVKSHLAQNKTVRAKRAYRGFFNTNDYLEENREQQKHLKQTNYLESFDADSERKVRERKETLYGLVEQTLQKISVDCNSKFYSP